MKLQVIDIENFANILEHLPPDTCITGPEHLPKSTVSLWQTTDDADESAAYVVVGEIVVRVAASR